MLIVWSRGKQLLCKCFVKYLDFPLNNHKQKHVVLFGARVTTAHVRINLITWPSSTNHSSRFVKWKSRYITISFVSREHRCFAKSEPRETLQFEGRKIDWSRETGDFLLCSATRINNRSAYNIQQSQNGLNYTNIRENWITSVSVIILIKDRNRPAKRCQVL